MHEELQCPAAAGDRAPVQMWGPCWATPALLLPVQVCAWPWFWAPASNEPKRHQPQRHQRPLTPPERQGTADPRGRALGVTTWQRRRPARTACGSTACRAVAVAGAGQGLQELPAVKAAQYFKIGYGSELGGSDDESDVWPSGAPHLRRLRWTAAKPTSPRKSWSRAKAGNQAAGPCLISLPCLSSASHERCGHPVQHLEAGLQVRRVRRHPPLASCSGQRDHPQ